MGELERVGIQFVELPQPGFAIVEPEFQPIQLAILKPFKLAILKPFKLAILKPFKLAKPKSITQSQPIAQPQSLPQPNAPPQSQSLTTITMTESPTSHGIPVIIHYKDDGKNDGRDLRITLRSFDVNIDYLGEVVVVGDTHDWLTDVTHIPFGHPYKDNKDANIIMACVKGAMHLLSTGYEDQVIVASDDCVMLTRFIEECYFEERFISFMRKFPKRARESKWWVRPFNSMIRCAELGWMNDNCDAHVPQLLSVGSILTLLDHRVGGEQLSAKTLMVNAERSFANIPCEYAPIMKVHPSDVVTGGFPPDRRFCNWSPSTESDEFHHILSSKFLIPSRFECAKHIHQCQPSR